MNKWYDIKARGAGPEREAAAEVFIYGDIGESWWAETVTAADFIGEINALDVNQLTVRINSYGGSVVDGIAIYNAIKRHPAAVTVCIDGVALSIASLIAMAGDSVEMAENAMLMIHAPWNVVAGNSADLRNEADILDKFASAMATSYASKSGMSIDDVMALLTDGADHWYTASEAQAAGLCDQVGPALALAASANRFTQPAAPRAKPAVNIPAAAAASSVSKGHTMPEITQNPAAPADVAAAQASAVAAVQARNKELIETGRAYAQFGGEDLAMQAVAEGWTQDQLNAALLSAASKGGAHASYGQGARAEENLDVKTHGFKSLGEFAFHVRNAALGNGRMDQRLRAAATTYGNEGAGADGGFAVPPQFAQSISSLALAEENLLAYADNTPISGNSMTFPKDETTPWGSTGVTATWDGEASTANQKKPVLQLDELRLKKLKVLVPATDELLRDAPAMSAYLAAKMSQAVRWKTNDSIINGTGAGMPKGILAAGSTVSIAKESGQAAASIVAANVAKMYSRVLRGNGQLVWLMNPDAFDQIVTMVLGNEAIWLPEASGIQGAPNGTLLGRPIVLTDACQTVGTAGDIILANMGGYRAITSAGGEEFSESMHLWFDQDVTAFKLIFRMDGAPALTSAITPANGTNKRSHFATVAVRA